MTNKVFYMGDSEKRLWDPAKIWTWVYWLPVLFSSNWTTGEALGIGVEDKCHLFIDTIWLSNHQTAAATLYVPLFI